MLRETVEQRILDNVNFSNGCWIWTASLHSNGYAQMSIDGRPRKVHRWFYEYLYGPIKDGLCLDHLCRKRNCINPFHLEPVTLKENILRGNGMSARHARQKRCVRGHEFDGKWRNSRRCSKCIYANNQFFNKKVSIERGNNRPSEIKSIVGKTRLSRLDRRSMALLCRGTQRPLQYVRFDGFKSRRERDHWYSMLWRRYSTSCPENFIRMVKCPRKNISAEPFYKGLVNSR